MSRIRCAPLLCAVTAAVLVAAACTTDPGDGPSTSPAAADPTPTVVANSDDDAGGTDTADDAGPGTGTGDEPTTDGTPAEDPAADDDGQADGDTTATPTPPPDATSLAGVTVELTTVIELDGRPVAVVAHPDGESLLVAEQRGVVRHWLPQPDGTFEAAGDPIIDVGDRISTGNEQGLLSLALHPDATHLYATYTDTDGANHLIETGLDGSGEREVLVVDQPFANHNGGHLVFGPDGNLYYGLGDGGGGGDPLGTGQDRSDLLGSILRLDPRPDGDAPYGIPADNPFVDDDGARPEIWVYGVRNPWRFDFDPATGDLWVADVGQNEIEEVDHLPAGDAVTGGRGANLGWSAFEGTVPFSSTSAPDAIDPVHQYDHSEGCSVTGGPVVRANDPALEGVYLFGDYCSGTIWGLVGGADADVEVAALGTVGSGLVSFAHGHAGEVFVLVEGGTVQRLTVA